MNYQAMTNIYIIMISNQHLTDNEIESVTFSKQRQNCKVVLISLPSERLFPSIISALPSNLPNLTF